MLPRTSSYLKVMWSKIQNVNISFILCLLRFPLIYISNSANANVGNWRVHKCRCSCCYSCCWCNNYTLLLPRRTTRGAEHKYKHDCDLLLLKSQWLHLLTSKYVTYFWNTQVHFQSQLICMVYQWIQSRWFGKDSLNFSHRFWWPCIGLKVKPILLCS